MNEISLCYNSTADDDDDDGQMTRRGCEMQD